MKRYFWALFAVILSANFALAQLPEHTLGIRFGSVYGIGTEVLLPARVQCQQPPGIGFGFQ